MLPDNEKTNKITEWALENRIHPAIYSYLIHIKDEVKDRAINLKNTPTVGLVRRSKPQVE